MKKILGLMALGILLASTGTAAAEGLKAVNISGSVVLDRGEEKSVLAEGAEVLEGDRLITDGDSRFDVVQEGDWGFRLLQSGDCRIAAAGESSQVELAQGNIIFNVKPQEGRELSVKTPVVVASVRGTQFWGQVTPAGTEHNAIFAVREGTVEIKVNASGKDFLVESGQALEIQGEKGSVVPRVASQAELEAISQAETIVL